MFRKIFLIPFLLLIIACDDNNFNPNFPKKNIQLTIYPGSGAYFDLGAIGGSLFLEGGVRGLVIYRDGSNSFQVFDRACPYNPQDDCEIVDFEKENSFKLIDKCCGSQFLITTGEVLNGPSEFNLQRYNYTFDGNELRIWN